MKKFYSFVILMAIIGVSAPVQADTAETIDFSIRFYDKRIYYAEGDPIKVQLTIANNSPASYRFKLADERAFSIDFDIRTMSNRGLEPADALTRKRSQSQQVFFREIAVESGESFSFVEDLRDYVNLKQAGSFIVQARVYPELYRSTLASQNTQASALESNRLNLNLRPPSTTGPDGIPVAMDEDTGANLVRKDMPPDEVVKYMITARQRSQWEKFFLYIDLEAMLSRDPNRRRIWLTEGEDGRRRMLAEFRQHLQNTRIDESISTSPSDFMIERTTYTGTEGTVAVLQKFKGSNYTEIKRYTYDLVRKDNIWIVVNYVVTNLGTE
ncbi:MAG: hypothetical protein LBH43_16520 [Treponema sp.]|jgi:hypothetical protein|nr:hypothetical protein [Treponema sp.]